MLTYLRNTKQATQTAMMISTEMTTTTTIAVRFKDGGGGVVVEDHGRDEVVEADKKMQ